ncbi:MAG: dihydroorotate dehydrogenase electron transfer subunit [Planctomycetaceae bacterium]|nr:MAG: dihydroorotate dehydrogenase electron transfer subunit [Planctomycetaceae bacterium]
MVSIPHKPVRMSGKIIFNREIAKGHFLMSLNVSGHFSSAEASFRGVTPGQFVMLRVKGREFPFLGRPISIHRLYPSTNDLTMELLYRVVGKGTSVISRLKPDDEIDILGPLGRGFDIFSHCKRVVLVAGGIGIAPLSFLGHYYGADTINKPNPPQIICYVGAQRKDLIVGLDRMGEICSDIRISTDDGSRGYHGLVTELFEQDILSYNSSDSVVYSCGPFPMIKRLAEILRNQAVPCQVSVEERMACGVGACLGVDIRVKSGYKKVCSDGPFFDINELIQD